MSSNISLIFDSTKGYAYKFFAQKNYLAYRYRNVENEAKRAQLLADHPDDPMTIVRGNAKVKLRVTHAIIVG